MKVRARAPATCGEYVQGIMENEPCLVSSPVEIFSETTVEPGTGQLKIGSKARAGINALIDNKKLDPGILDTVDITTVSGIPVGIGMASSTANIASAVSALAAYAGEELSPDEISEICIAVEPSDNLMYPHLNLYNHYTGRIFADFDATIETPVTIVEYPDVVDTVDFGYETEFKKDVPAFGKVLDDFSRGLKSGDIARIAMACSESARINQTALEKPHLESVIELALSCGGLGVLIGHSGSVIGVFEGEDFDYDRFRERITAAGASRVYRSRLIPGGIRLEYTA